jgi:WD40 repeat protein
VLAAGVLTSLRAVVSSSRHRELTSPTSTTTTWDWIARHDGSRERLLARGACCVAWSPSGRLLAYWNRGPVVASADGRTKRRLPNGSDFAWSPSGGQLAIATDRSLKIVGFRGRYERTVATAEAVAYGSPFERLAWSADGWLSYVRDGTLFVLPQSGGVPRALNALGVVDYRWAPGGRRVAFSRTDGLWVMGVPHGTPRLLASGRQTGSRAVMEWSPDGRLVAWMRDWYPRSVFTVAAGGGPPKRVGSFGNPDEEVGDLEGVDLDWQVRPRK